ncbi:C2H2 and C2HC zinc fingers superfamily protein, putative isoform 1 [Hibiscus syriacus]|uniref:C2H2 and C2HC zinc fingers superfamily protein, putative isoform 1 n=1 Tax=Hibiscus syriacus TaxID=106335 RepID=A0A6A2YBT9_HIBSY|nr:C2H2 and C2HC zinc fingers superfamily protein, putative isoform 1 [Hibiscus syriacus]
METVLGDPNCNLADEASPDLLLPPDSPVITDIFGNLQLSPRVGDEYQVEIPPMITGSEHLRLLMDPLDSEGIPYLAHSFLLGLPVPVMWTHEQDTDFEDDGKGGPSKLNDGSKVDKPVKSRKSRGQISKRKKNLEPSAEQSDVRLIEETESNAENFECEMSSKTSLFRPCEGKKSHLIPGSSGYSWSDAEVDGLTDTADGQMAKKKELGEMFMDGKSLQAGGSRNCYLGCSPMSPKNYKMIFRSYCVSSIGSCYLSEQKCLQVFLRIVSHGPLMPLLCFTKFICSSLFYFIINSQVSKSFVEGRTSLENYVFHLKTSVGICALVEAVGLNKGKADLTGLAMEPPRITQFSTEIPSGKACSYLTSGDIIKFLTGGFRLSKARCNDIFWEAVWPRLLARGWHSEQPKNQWSVSSNHYLVFLMPGVKKFSRRKLVKGNHYFDSVSDVLSKIASEPTLIELDAEGNGIGSCKEENGFLSGESSDEDNSPNHKTCYLKPQVSILSSNHMKFTVIDSSLMHGGKASKMRELKYLPIDLMVTSKPMQKDAQDSRKESSNHMLSKGDKCATNARHREGKIGSSTASHSKFTIVDSSLLRGGKSSGVRELRCLPVEFEISSKVSNSSGGDEDNSSGDSSDEYEQKLSDRLSSHGSVATDTKPSNKPVTASNLLKGYKNNGEGKYDNDSSKRNPKISCIADRNFLIHQDEKINTSEDTRPKQIIKHQFSRRAKSSHAVNIVSPAKRKKLTAFANTETSEKSAALSIGLASPMKQQKLTACAKMDRSHLTENISGNPIHLISLMKRQRLNACAKTEQSCLTEKLSVDTSEQMGLCSNGVPDTSHSYDKVSSVTSAEGNPESMETPQGSSEKLPSLSSISSSPPLLLPEAQNGEPRVIEANCSQFNIVNNRADFFMTASNVCAKEQQPTVNAQRQSVMSLDSGMPKKNQTMAEADLSGLQKQIEELTALVKQGRDETNPPKWWENQENRINALESRMETNQGYVEELLKILTGRTGDQVQSVGEQVQSLDTSKNKEKTPVMVTVLNDKSRFTYKTDEPGILKSKPDDCLAIKNSYRPENQMGENSDSRPIIVGLDAEKKGPGSSFSSGIMWNRPKIELPFFEGVNPRGWVQKCLKYFSICGVPVEQRVELATMYLTGKAEVWFDGYIMQKHHVTWHEFEADLCHRFSDRTFSDIVEEFTKLTQKGSVEDYQEKFEELQPHMLLQNPTLTEEFFVSLFISGLRDDIKHRVKALDPKNLSEASKQAKLYELSVEFENRRVRSSFKNPPYPNPLYTSKPTLPIPTKPTAVPNPKQNLMDYRRQNNLCFKCGEKYLPGHQCKTRQLNMITEEVDPSLLEVCPTDAEQIQQQEEENLEISMNAITGCIGHNTLRIQGTIQGKPLNILIDSGSTHSFLTPTWADAGIQINTAYPLAITVANGQQLFSSARCNKVKWEMQGHTFSHDFRLLKLGGSDMVLGVDWMKLFSPILMDFNNMTLSFDHEGEQICIQGQQPSTELYQISGATLLKMSARDSDIIGHIILLTMTGHSSSVPIELQPILDKYSKVFAEPEGLPPQRSHDHAIPLIPTATPVNLRPYRFPHNQKTEVEKQIAAMLSSSVIQPSRSPFASPCLLIKKKDGTWRFCVDYRQLNSLTIKDKFPIPIVEDLLDELNGAVYFSKIDLRSGYWQIRIKPEDIYKTAFRTHQGHYEFKVMPFGLTNAPATFQALMNELFSSFLRKFVLVFFDDILIYSSSMQQHVEHLRLVLEVLKVNQLFAKLSKCFFGQTTVEYLGHIISAAGVSTDPSKVEVMQNWPQPKTLKSLRGFLGLTGYYRRFIRHYGIISKPLTQMLKKDGFHWNSAAYSAFEDLKKAMCSAPVLALPDFSKTFYLETDASSGGVGAVLSQEGRPIAYLSKALSPRHSALSIYEREYLAILLAVSKWRHYLESASFIIKTDHEPLKFLLEQKLTTTIQKKGLTKLLGLDYTIQYRKGKSNVVADALSRRWEDQAQCLTMGVTVLIPGWVQEIEESYKSDSLAQNWISILTITPLADSKWKFSKAVLRYDGRVYIGATGSLRLQIIQSLHDSPQGGHSGAQATYYKIRSNFYWPNLKSMVAAYVRCCQTCQQTKVEHLAKPGLLQPLPIPNQAWEIISMDFIEGLPTSLKKNCILVIVDKFTKYSHFLPLAHPYSAAELGTKTVFSTAYHPETDGQTERVNQCLEQYLRGFCFYKPKQWTKWLSHAEWWYNTTYHTALKLTPFQALYGYKPPIMVWPTESTVHTIAEIMNNREVTRQLIQTQLQMASNRMKQQQDKNRTERVFEVGDMVYLKLQPYRQTSIALRKNLKLAAKYYGPYKILEKIGKVAYRLDLPKSSRLHPVFHVSLLKKFIGDSLIAVTEPPTVDEEGGLQIKPLKIMARRIVNRKGKPVTQLLVRWENLTEENDTWEDYTTLKGQFPAFDPWGQGSSRGMGIVMVGEEERRGSIEEER